ncbi:hypothetical protein FGO68_gene3735 [Halteria grandinella]|uniref:protein-L-isoaspartate(D-aspartate) O-methyltransferase n=1 Tax=Halteria grandinella TaxID=5974 RepID=A0A8J8T8W9_HALGN|nr:hypothetical protein FGO68_gene3735 [Halteria grandinella]
MGWSAKQPKSHQEHYQTLKNLNIYTDSRDIDPAFKHLDKRDFCIPKKNATNAEDFNPYTVDPQNIGHNQCFTSTVMHAISLQVLREGIMKKLQRNRVLRMVDYGCGYGYSTLAFAIMVDNMMKYEKGMGKLEIMGADVYQDFIEKAIMNSQNYRGKIVNQESIYLGFQVNDYLESEQKLKFKTQGPIDIMNFGFETSLEALETKRNLLASDALILAPISKDELGSLEQTYTLLQNSRQGFKVVSEIMKTSFSMRVDKEKQVNDGLDADYFVTYKMSEQLKTFKESIKRLEGKFVALRKIHGGETLKLGELMKVEEIKQVLIELGDAKKKAQKLEFAIRDTTEQAEEDDNQEIKQ